MENIIQIKDLKKEYTDSTGYTNVLFSGLNFIVEKNKITSILAPTGSGKSSLLKIVAGLEAQTTGEIIPGELNTAFIPSFDSIFPWLNVKENITYNFSEGLQPDIDSAINFAGLDGYEDHYPHPKSSGFILRVALARSILRKPDLILLDEPFETVKPSVRQDLMELVRRISTELGITILIASANIGRSIFMSDKLFVMRKNPGEIVEAFDINLDRVRNKKLFSSEEYISWKNRVEDTIEKISGLNEYEFTL